MKVIVTGVPGVGKTTVMEKAASIANIKILNYGSVMFELASKNGLVKNRDELRRLPLEVNRNLQETAADEINKAGSVILDTHATIRTPRGYWVGLPMHVLMLLMPDVVVVLEANEEEIFRRRQADMSREWGSETVADICNHQLMNRSAAISFAMVSGGCVKIITNDEGQLDQASGELAALFS